MSRLQHGVERYLRLRRALGFKLIGWDAYLHDFASYSASQGVDRVTTALAVQWATSPVGASAAYLASRLATVRRFAAWWSTVDTRSEVPPLSLLSQSYRRQYPYIYTQAEITSLLRSTLLLRSARGLRGQTYATVFGLLAITGMRISEAVALDRADVDLTRGTVSIRRAKSGRPRVLPIHPSTQAALQAYAKRRDKVVPVSESQAFFISDVRGTRITVWSTQYNFARVSQRSGLRASADRYRHGVGPRIHDLRHRFAVQTLITWYRRGLQIDQELPKLSAYLGHVHVSDTYWYLEAVPELMHLAAKRVAAADRRRS